jgi:hypothetical protein
MRALVVLVCFAFLGCDDDAYYADGSPWSTPMPLSPGRVSPAQMDARQWASFVTQSGIQADRTVKTFTPTWTGFSSAPSGDLAYQDFGRLVVLFNPSGANLTGTSNVTTMSISNIPVELQPPTGEARDIKTLVIDNGSRYEGVASLIGADLVFGCSIIDVTRVLAPNGQFTNSGSKGVPAGWLIMWAK